MWDCEMPLAWFNLIAASATGDSHLDSGTECQDAFDYCYSVDREWLAVTVCDGAGSSKQSGVASSYVSGRFSRELIKIATRLSKRQFGSWVTDEILNAVLTIRGELREIAKSDDLKDFHTTLVAVLLGPASSLGGRAGLGVHIGDGAIFGGDLGNDRETSTCYLDEKFFIFSHPENGEYANETYFVTETQWIKRIRVTPLQKTDWIALATDGGCSVALTNNQTPRAPFLPDLITKIVSADPDEYHEILGSMLNDPGIRSLTDDDKTIVILLGNSNIPKTVSSFSLKSVSVGASRATWQAKPTAVSASIRGNIQVQPDAHQEGAGRPRSTRLIVWLTILASIILLSLGFGINDWAQRQGPVPSKITKGASVPSEEAAKQSETEAHTAPYLTPVNPMPNVVRDESVDANIDHGVK
jgi:serine/threonine protein phosphatase PrpC